MDNHHKPNMLRRTCLGTCLALLTNALVMAPSSALASRQLAISWDQLIPQTWNAIEELGELFPPEAEDWDDEDPRAQALLKRMRERMDAAPTVSQFDGKAIRLPGYVVPLEQTRDGLVELLLVPSYGDCIHTPPPAANQIIHIRLEKPIKGIASMDAVWASGELHQNRNASEMGVSGYSMQNANLRIFSSS